MERIPREKEALDQRMRNANLIGPAREASVDIFARYAEHVRAGF